MVITKKEFEILYLLLQPDVLKTQRFFSEKTGYSLGSVNHLLHDLEQRRLISGYSLTDEGYAVMEHYRVKRAVFLAAGFGSRLMPVTLNTPKPLVIVNGKRLIDGLIDACLAADIRDIYIVTGYRSDQFKELLVKYPNIHLIYNLDYNRANNIASACLVCDLMENAYVMEADLLIRDPGLIRSYEYSSNFLGFPVKSTDDWCFTVKGGVICNERLGGTDCYQMIGISYWDQTDGQRLAKDLPEVYHSPGGKERFWEQVPLQERKENYRVEIRCCSQDSFYEIDTLDELQDIDPVYGKR